MDVIKKTIEIYDKYAKRYHLYNDHKLVQDSLNFFISLIPNNAKVLDVGCGTGRDSNYFHEEGFNVIGIDLSEGMLKEAKKNYKDVEFKKMDLMDLKFGKEEFDGIWSMVSIVHIPKKQVENVLKNFNDILKKAGIMYISVKEGEGEKIIKDKRYDEVERFFTFYKKEEIENLLRKNKFKIIKSELTANRGNRWIEIICQKI